MFSTITGNSSSAPAISTPPVTGQHAVIRKICEAMQGYDSGKSLKDNLVSASREKRFITDRLINVLFKEPLSLDLGDEIHFPENWGIYKLEIRCEQKSQSQEACADVVSSLLDSIFLEDQHNNPFQDFIRNIAQQNVSKAVVSFYKGTVQAKGKRQKAKGKSAMAHALSKEATVFAKDDGIGLALGAGSSGVAYKQGIVCAMGEQASVSAQENGALVFAVGANRYAKVAHRKSMGVAIDGAMVEVCYKQNDAIFKANLFENNGFLVGGIAVGCGSTAKANSTHAQVSALWGARAEARAPNTSALAAGKGSIASAIELESTAVAYDPDCMVMAWTQGGKLIFQDSEIKKDPRRLTSYSFNQVSAIPDAITNWQYCDTEEEFTVKQLLYVSSISARVVIEKFDKPPSQWTGDSIGNYKCAVSMETLKDLSEKCSAVTILKIPIPSGENRFYFFDVMVLMRSVQTKCIMPLTRQPLKVENIFQPCSAEDWSALIVSGFANNHE